AAGGDGDCVRQSERNIALTVEIVAPGYDAAVGAQGQAVPGARSDGDQIGGEGWEADLAPGVVTPGPKNHDRQCGLRAERNAVSVGHEHRVSAAIGCPGRADRVG